MKINQKSFDRVVSSCAKILGSLLMLYAGVMAVIYWIDVVSGKEQMLNAVVFLALFTVNVYVYWSIILSPLYVYIKFRKRLKFYGLANPLFNFDKNWAGETIYREKLTKKEHDLALIEFCKENFCTINDKFVINKEHKDYIILSNWGR